jgi:hypothetical protein
MVAEFKRLLSGASAGVFQSRTMELARVDKADGELVWVSVLSSATCRFTPRARQYVFRGRTMVQTDFCFDRHGMRGDARKFARLLPPRAGGTVCLQNCECTLVPAAYAAENPGLLAPVDLGTPTA